MSRFMNTIWIFTISVFLFLHITIGHPVDKVSADSKLELKDETRYPNGTVVGKYSYTDNEGNPINVKYYADETSYGVELNSFKIIDTTTNHPLQPPQLTTSNTMDYMKPMEPLLDLASEIMSFHKTDAEKNKPDVISDKKVSPINKVSQVPHGVSKATKINSPDYETFYQNEVKAPKQCEKEKVRVYLVKEKRKTRSLLVDDEASTYCEQF